MGSAKKRKKKLAKQFHSSALAPPMSPLDAFFSTPLKPKAPKESSRLSDSMKLLMGQSSQRDMKELLARPQVNPEDEWSAIGSHLHINKTWCSACGTMTLSTVALFGSYVRKRDGLVEHRKIAEPLRNLPFQHHIEDKKVPLCHMCVPQEVASWGKLPTSSPPSAEFPPSKIPSVSSGFNSPSAAPESESSDSCPTAPDFFS